MNAFQIGIIRFLYNLFLFTDVIDEETYYMETFYIIFHQLNFKQALYYIFFYE